MDKMRNPFAPGAGVLPPELAGREGIIDDATINIQRATLGLNCRSQMLLGLRGVGKTVLLNKLEDICHCLKLRFVLDEFIYRLFIFRG